VTLGETIVDSMVVRGRWTDGMVQILLLLNQMLLCNQIQILHQALALVMLGRVGNLHHVAGRGLEVFGAATDLLHVLGLLLVLHYFPLLALLAADCVLVLNDELVVLLRVGKVFFL